MEIDWRKQEFLDWLCTIKEERDPPTQRELAEKLGANEVTLQNWKKDGDFLAAWERQYRKTVGSPEKMQTVMQRLYETAVDRTDPRQVQAAREYRQAVEGVAPQKVEMTVRKDLSEMSDDELNALASQFVKEEKAQRADPA